MGSLASRPTIPNVQTVYTPVYMPAAPSPSTPAPPTGNSTAGGNDAGATPPPAEDQAGKEQTRRTSSLLERNRGVLGTVLTSFRGLLNTQTPPRRKTLLGE